MTQNKGASAKPTGSGSAEAPEPHSGLGPAGAIPGAVAELRDNADSLHKWFKSMDEQRRDWTYPQGVEVTARDALEGVYRIAVSVVAGLQQAASAIEAATAGETVKLGSTEGESAVGATSAETPALSSPRRG